MCRFALSWAMPCVTWHCVALGGGCEDNNISVPLEWLKSEFGKCWQQFSKRFGLVGPWGSPSEASLRKSLEGSMPSRQKVTEASREVRSLRRSHKVAELFVTLRERVTGGQQGGPSTPFPQLRGPSCGMLCLGTPGRSKPAQNDAEKCAGFYTH